jgi:hypothetical protein
MYLLMPHRKNRQMRVVRLDAKANKRKIADTLPLASLRCVALPQRQLLRTQAADQQAAIKMPEGTRGPFAT